MMNADDQHPALIIQRCLAKSALFNQNGTVIVKVNDAGSPENPRTKSRPDRDVARGRAAWTGGLLICGYDTTKA